MRFPALLCALALLQAANGQPVNDVDALEKRQSGSILTTGIAGFVYPRLEIRQMQTEQPDQFTLLLLTLEQWQQVSQNNDTSYFGISRIHGAPLQDWDRVSQCAGCSGAVGYCHHNMMTFPAWHRAYLALFEQNFVRVATAIARDWPTANRGDQMRKAAASIRWPFFDWAALPPNNGPAMPWAISSATVTVTAQNGRRSFTNPLYQHGFQDSSGLVWTPYTNWPRTLRYPSSDSSRATSTNSSLTGAFSRNRISLRDRLYTLLTGCNNYFQFSNSAANGGGSCYNSLEQIHNDVHNFAGGTGSSRTSPGHMAILAEAAFDPIFWLHHCNVDRLFAMWQVLYSDYSASQQVSSDGGTWTIAGGSNIDMNTPLHPFRKTATTFWTSNDVKNPRVFGYDYIDFNRGRTASVVKARIDALYGPSASATAGSSRRRDPQLSALNQILPGNPLKARNGTLFQYFCNIAAPRFALNGSYNVFVFDRAPKSPSTADWISDERLIGTIGIFSQPGRTSNGITAKGQIPLTTYLADKQRSGVLKDLTQASVNPFLKDNLKILVLGPDGDSVDPDSIPDFTTNVYASTLDQGAPAGSSFSSFQPLIDVSKALPGNTTGGGQ